MYVKNLKKTFIKALINTYTINIYDNIKYENLYLIN